MFLSTRYEILIKKNSYKSLEKNKSHKSDIDIIFVSYSSVRIYEEISIVLSDNILDVYQCMI